VQDKAIPVLVHLPSGVKVTAIRAGCTTGFALTSAGRVLAWGNNGNGELGIGSTTDMPTPVPVQLPAGTKVKAISAGETFGLALTRSGRVWAWGNNPDGELGNGTTAQSDIPVLVTLPAGVTVTGLAAGSAHSMALTSAGQVLSWGRNNSGQLGDGTTDNSHIPVMTTLPSGTRVRNFFAGCEDSLVRTASGRLLAWGANGSGQLGDGTTTSRSLPVAVRLPKGVRVTNISAGCLHNLAVTADGGVLAWGVNNAGQLGDGTTAPIRRTPVHVRIPAGLSVIAIGSGQTSSASLAIVH
jgi:alpha-tubulin suppressor-like RCC1 family protein